MGTELPIDINYGKLTEWLVTRQKLPTDWHKRVQAIQAKIAQASKELPPGLLSSLPGGADVPIDYLRAIDIRDKLAETAERTIFGGLSGQAGIWDKIVKAYEKGSVFLGEAAQAMVQNVDYEIPYLRKQLAKFNQQITDADRKHVEYLRSAASCAAGYKQECAKQGIAGADVQKELLQLVAQVPSLLEEVLDKVSEPAIGEAVKYYQGFTTFAHATGPNNSFSPTPTLVEVREGTTQVPAALLASQQQQPAASSSKEPQIDWDLDAPGTGQVEGAAASAAPADISWDIELPAAGEAAGGIDWDLDAAALEEQQAEAAGAADESAGAEGGISWDIEITDAAEVAGGSEAAPVQIDWDIEVDAAAEGAGAAGAGQSAAADLGSALDQLAGVSGAAAGTAPTGRAASLLRLERDSEYRSLLLDDLQELRGFLALRRGALAGSGQEILSALMPEALHHVDAAAAGKMLAAVDAALATLTAPRLKQLLMIASSRRYLDRLAANLQRRAGQEARMQAAAREVVARQHEARGALVGLHPKVSELVERTKRLKVLTERTMPGLVNGRQVNVLGEINTVLFQGS